VTCAAHRGQSVPCALCALERRMPDLGEWRLEAQAQYIERLTQRVPMTGQVQGEALHIASLLRDLAKKITP
jgi:hypothetical protein